MNPHSNLFKHKPLFDDFVGRRTHTLSAYHFSSIFLWQDFFEFSFEVIDDYLCVWASHGPGTFLYLPPLGKDLNASVLEQCFLRLRRINTRKGVGRIENLAQGDLSLFPSPLRAIKKADEYCYRRDDIADLKGNAYKSKRSDYNRFIKSHHHEFVPFDRRWTQDCLALYRAWAHDRAARSSDDIFRAMLEENYGVHRLIFEHFEELGLQGRVVLVDQKPQAYSFGYSLNPDTFCVLVEIVNLRMKGLSAYIFSRFCADEALGRFQWINAMDDFAMDGVAAAKRSYRPSVVVPCYVVSE